MIFSKMKNYKKKKKKKQEEERGQVLLGWQAMLVPCPLKEEPTCGPARENCA
jgi:hypothetical protein